MMTQAHEKAMEHRHNEHVADALGIGIDTLKDYPFDVARTPVTTMWRETGMIYGWRILWTKQAPPGIDVHGTPGAMWSDIPAPLGEPDSDIS